MPTYPITKAITWPITTPLPNSPNQVAVAPFTLDEFAPTAAFSVSRQLVSTYEDAFYTLTSGAVSSFNDQTGNARNLTQATAALRPTVVTKFRIPALDFAVGGNRLVGPNLTEFITSTSAYMVISFASRTVSRSDMAANGIITDAAEGGNISVSLVSGEYKVYAFQFDGTYDVTPKTTIYNGSPYVVTFRKDATKLYCRVNLGAEVEVDNGTLTAMAFAIGLSRATPNNFDGQMFEFATWATVPAVEDRDTIVTAFMTKLGIPTTAPDLSSFPTAATTGYTGALSASGALSISTPGVYENLDITGDVNISVNGVTLRNCKITTNDNYCVRIQDGFTATVEYCEINGLGTGNTTGIAGNGTFRYNNIYNVENGIVITGTNAVVTRNYVHDLAALTDPHYDAVECNGGQNGATITYNTLICNQTQTSSININNFFSAIDGLTISNNYIKGGTYAVYVDAQFAGGTITNVVIVDNYVSKGTTGFFNFNLTSPTSSGNREAETGIPLYES